VPITALIRAAHTNLGSGVSNVVGGRTYWPVEYVDPRPKAAYLNSGRMPPSDGFFTPVNFVGAFGTRNWAKWTLAAYIGILDAGPTFSDYSSFDDNLSVANIMISGTAPQIAFPSAAGQSYNIERATSVFGPWTVIGSTNSPGGTITFTDPSPPSDENVFYRLTSALVP
jgi:hypothetical protein